MTSFKTKRIDMDQSERKQQQELHHTGYLITEHIYDIFKMRGNIMGKWEHMR